ncbi:MAG: 50S ribosomal protein L25/general stress protein Ctc [Chitinophagales bacterium]|nr:50S ribosomal protein L25/general stress protein Ctc [Bacteroidota bacterium]MBX7141378.1 50S ribosomal protein L25/general stress protein Ctc [Chitinophagales bacterium]
MKAINIEGKNRSDIGKKSTAELRKNGHIPCSIYGGEKNVNFYAPKVSFKELVYTPEFYAANITVDGNTYNCVMQDLQFHPITDEILHIDFRELNPEKKITVELPVKLEGTAAGTREGGKVNQRMKRLRVRLLPKDLVEHITVKIDHLTLGKSVRVGEMQMEGIEFLNAPHIPIVSVLVPRVEKEETPAAATAETAAAATPAAGTAPAAGAAPAAEKKEEKKK